jgi:hypothetical protein
MIVINFARNKREFVTEIIAVEMVLKLSGHRRDGTTGALIEFCFTQPKFQLGTFVYRMHRIEALICVVFCRFEPDFVNDGVAAIKLTAYGM